MDDKHHIPREHGQLGEIQARKHLEQQGLTFVEQNVRYKFGEIDLVMRQGKTLIFVEVKYRSKSQFGGALHALSTKQIQRLRRAAEHYMQIKHLDVICRFDLIGIEPDRIYWLKNAF
ncbi:YraN family protein [Shewanella benthica]|uniref:YraN family protein n=1 Tax=Shewanella benthica TaxID=43661 RepID=UPI001879EE92|nr:YraN family protein [Shewanella benthica]MBE7214393.1 YraN family protein [Shewanella benthica]MCL1061460.1 YraN family protein [Shewanella benthica]